MIRIRPLVIYRNEIAVLGALLAAVLFALPNRPPVGFYLVGMASGGALALHAVAIVLVYRANGFLNFAQLQFAVFAATIFAGLVNGRPLLRLFTPDSAPGGFAGTANFIIAVVVTVGVMVGGTVLVYQTLIRRFMSAPRMMPTLVTIFLAQALVTVGPTVLGWLQPLPSPGDLGRGIPNGPASGPIDFSWQVGEVALSSADVLTLGFVIVAAVGITVYLRRSAAGVAIRAAGENPDRARTLGLDVFGVTTRVWILVGLLAAVAGMLQAFVQGAPLDTGGGGEAGGGEIGVLPVGELVLVLTVAVIARFASLPMAVLGGFVLGVVRTGVQWAFNSTVLFEAALVLLVGGLLLLQRDRRSRTQREEEALSLQVAREPRPVPPELRRLGVVRQWSQAGIAVGAIVLVGLPWLLTVGQTSLAGTFLIAAVVGLSLLILTGWAGQISLGQWGFAAIGAWVVAVTGLPLLVALPLAGLVGAVASIVIGFPALKLRGLQLGVATLAFAWSITFVLFDDGFLGSHVPTSLWLDLGDVKIGYYAALVFAVLFVVATIGLRRSRFGRALIAARSNDEGAEAFGIDPRWLRLTAFAVAGAYAAVAGAMFAAHQGTVVPESFTADQSVQMFMFTVVGGLGSVAGPLVGFALLGVLTFAAANPVVAFFGAGVGPILLLVAAPGGLVEIFHRVRDAALRRLAIRHRIAAASLLGDRATNRLQEHALLREYSGGQEPVLPPVRYEPVGQWALERYGLEGATKERVGLGGGKGTANGHAGGGRAAKEGPRS